MYEDKTLVCKECGNEFVFTAGEQGSMPSAALPMSPSAARPAVTPVSRTREPTVRCSPPSAPTAAKRRRFPSVPVRTVLFIAASALQR